MWQLFHFTSSLTNEGRSELEREAPFNYSADEMALKDGKKIAIKCVGCKAIAVTITALKSEQLQAIKSAKSVGFFSRTATVSERFFEWKLAKKYLVLL